VCGTEATETIWDLHLLRGSSSSGGGADAGVNDYGLQVLGRAGEVPRESMVVAVQLSSVRWADGVRLRYRLKVCLVLGVDLEWVGGLNIVGWSLDCCCGEHCQSHVRSFLPIIKSPNQYTRTTRRMIKAPSGLDR